MFIKFNKTSPPTKFSLFSTTREPSVKRKDLRNLNLAVPTSQNPVLDPSSSTPRQLTMYDTSWLKMWSHGKQEMISLQGMAEF